MNNAGTNDDQDSVKSKQTSLMKVANVREFLRWSSYAILVIQSEAQRLLKPKASCRETLSARIRIGILTDERDEIE